VKKSRIVVYPGSFDPVTNGHLDIICRACQIFEHVIVAVTQNSTKSSLFSIDERLRMLNLVLAPVVKSGKVRVDSFSGLLADYCRQQGAQTVARGLRALSDFEYEFQMALMNRHLAPELETVFLMFCAASGVARQLHTPGMRLPRSLSPHKIARPAL
jgi:pantetheine-phosphate adenylyltransferase